MSYRKENPINNLRRLNHEAQALRYSWTDLEKLKNFEKDRVDVDLAFRENIRTIRDS